MFYNDVVSKKYKYFKNNVHVRWSFMSRPSHIIIFKNSIIGRCVVAKKNFLKFLHFFVFYSFFVSIWFR